MSNLKNEKKDPVVKIGSVACLKSNTEKNSVIMTVIGVSGNDIECVWHTSCKFLTSEIFPYEVLNIWDNIFLVPVYFRQ